MRDVAQDMGVLRELHFAGADRTFDAAVDHIDLSQIDARTDKAGDQAFHLVAKFTHAAGELVLTYDSGANATHVKCDVDGDGKADLFFDVTGHLTDTSGFVL